jgi:hypothetical protein
MFRRFLQILFVAAAVVAGAGFVHAQSAEERTSTLLGRPPEDERPRSIRESMIKMRIAQEKKEYDQMLTRGEEALKLSEQVEKTFSENGRLTEADYDRIENIEKLAKKIRTELGGNDDGEKEAAPAQRRMLSPAEAVKSLRSMTVSLYDELKKTSRFSISITAIQSTNALLSITRFLRITN